MATSTAAPPGLRFTNLDTPGIRRRRAGRGWCFIDPAGRPIRCAETRARLLAVALPPAYREAWYNPDPRGHIQAVGVDARGRRQYRYHPDFRADRESDKFAGLAAFGAALPGLRAAVTRSLRRGGLGRDRVVAAVVRLLDCAHLRVGNEQYARSGKSYGATTLRRRHVRLEGGRVMLRFRGKGGVEQRLALSDRALTGVVRRCQELPGQHLFCWEDEAGGVHPVSSSDVNAWLRSQSGLELSAKQFRTWWASVLALAHLEQNPGSPLAAMLEDVAGRLGNTPAVARRSYVHPAVIALARGEVSAPVQGRGPRRLSAVERRLMALIAAGS